MEEKKKKTNAGIKNFHPYITPKNWFELISYTIISNTKNLAFKQLN